LDSGHIWHCYSFVDKHSFKWPAYQRLAFKFPWFSCNLLFILLLPVYICICIQKINFFFIQFILDNWLINWHLYCYCLKRKCVFYHLRRTVKLVATVVFGCFEVIVIGVGTSNHEHTVEQIVNGLLEIVQTCQQKHSQAQIVIMVNTLFRYLWIMYAPI